METSGTFADFMQQIPAGIINIFILLGVLLVFTVVALVYVRVRRANQQSKPPSGNGGGISFNFSGFGGGGTSNPQQPAPTPHSTPTPSGGASGDMPDLDMLLGGVPTAPNPAPTPSPAPTPPADPIAEPSFLQQPGVLNVRMSADGRVVEATEMLVIARDRVSDNLIVQIGDNAYDGTEGGVDPDFRRRFVKIMRELSDIAPELSKSSGKAASSAPAPRPKPTPAPTAAPTPPAAEPEPDDAPTDLAGQIEMYLQRKLQTAPKMAGRGIHVHSAPAGGVRIEVDGQFYESVDDVEDAAVRQYLQQTIAEWQAR